MTIFETVIVSPFISPVSCTVWPACTFKAAKSWLPTLYTLPPLTNTYLALWSLTQARVQSRSDIFLPPCSAVVLWFAPHILSLICPVQVWSAAKMHIAPSILATTAIHNCFINSPLVHLANRGHRQPFTSVEHRPGRRVFKIAHQTSPAKGRTRVFPGQRSARPS